MSKKNLNLAEKIIAQFGDLQRQADVSVPIGDTLELETKKVWSVDLMHIIGMGFAGRGDSEKEAKSEIIKQLASALDNGELDLADSFVEQAGGTTDDTDPKRDS